MGRESANGDEPEILELDENDIADADEGGEDDGDEDEDEDEDEGDAADDDGEDEGDVTLVGFEDEEATPAEPENATIREMRQQIRALSKELTEARSAKAVEEQAALGEKPTLADFDYDEEAFETALDDWKTRKAKVDEAKAKAAEVDKRVQQEWQQDLTSYHEKKAKLGFADHDAAEETVKGALNQVQQATIIKAASDPAVFIYALGRSKTKLADLAKIDDPIKLAAQVARMEGGISVKKNKAAPALDRAEKGSAGMGVKSSDAKLAALEAKAAKTGDRTPVIAYKKAMKSK